MNDSPLHRKIGLALSGGAARGLSQVGVLQILQKEGIPIDMIAGTSSGAICGSSYAWDQDTARMVRDTIDVNWKKLRPLIDPSFPKTGFIKGKKITRLLSTYVGGNTRFSDLKIPFVCVATDIDTGEEVVIDSGPVAEAVRASISIPGIFRLVERDGKYLVDGGLSTPVPVEVVRRMGADFIIAINTNPDVAYRMTKTPKKKKPHKEPNIFQVMLQSVYIATYSLAQTSSANADIVIEPDLSDIGAGDFNKTRELLKRGREAGQKAIPEIKRMLAVI